MEFTKYHALGNDYLVAPADGLTRAGGDPWEAELLPPHVVERVCHRNFGLGSDGILAWAPAPAEAEPACDFVLRILNPDGGEAEKSGNGLRIFALHLARAGLAAAGAPIRILTRGGPTTAVVAPSLRSVRVDMGAARVAAAPEAVAGFEGSVASVGNPHFVVRVARGGATEAAAREAGPQLERHARFPEGTNVQLADVCDERTVRVQIWERGAGYTLASGSSSCAVAAVCVARGWCAPGVVRVVCPGGTIEVTVPADAAEPLMMEGAVRCVGAMVPDPALLAPGAMLVHGERVDAETTVGELREAIAARAYVPPSLVTFSDGCGDEAAVGAVAWEAVEVEVGSL